MKENLDAKKMHFLSGDSQMPHPKKYVKLP
jgi:hypothetical protein